MRTRDTAPSRQRLERLRRSAERVQNGRPPGEVASFMNGRETAAPGALAMQWADRLTKQIDDYSRKYRGSRIYANAPAHGRARRRVMRARYAYRRYLEEELMRALRLTREQLQLS